MEDNVPHHHPGVWDIIGVAQDNFILNDDTGLLWGR